VLLDGAIATGHPSICLCVRHICDASLNGSRYRNTFRTVW